MEKGAIKGWMGWYAGGGDQYRFIDDCRIDVDKLNPLIDQNPDTGTSWSYQPRWEGRMQAGRPAAVCRRSRKFAGAESRTQVFGAPSMRAVCAQRERCACGVRACVMRISSGAAHLRGHLARGAAHAGHPAAAEAPHGGLLLPRAPGPGGAGVPGPDERREGEFGRQRRLAGPPHGVGCAPVGRVRRARLQVVLAAEACGAPAAEREAI